MARVYETLALWARKTTSFAELLVTRGERTDESQPPQPGELIYRLKHWPDLPERLKTADVLRTLSVMSNRPVNRRWILAHSRLKGEQVDDLLQRLTNEDAVSVIDTTGFRPSGS
jgi:hypothetical protein